jgi:D-3-phosphoglycerate dehydrogenase
VSYAKEKNIPVINAPGLSSDAVSEIAIAHIISLFRHYYKAVNTVKNGLWEKNNLVGKTLSKKTLGVVSYGKVGKKVALFGKIMDMEVLVYDPYIEENIIAEIGAKKVELNHLLSHSDIISIHSPLTPETEKMLNHRTMCTLKKGVYIVNVGRGALIDEDALYENIINGKIAGVGLDVMALEPHPQNNKLIKLDSVLVTPHIGGSTYESQKTISLHVANGILKALNCL